MRFVCAVAVLVVLLASAGWGGVPTPVGPPARIVLTAKNTWEVRGPDATCRAAQTVPEVQGIT